MRIGEIHAAISTLLQGRLVPLIQEGRDLNLVSCIEIYTIIFETLVEVIKTTELPITNEGMNYLAQQYYDAVQVNGGQELDPAIFTQRAVVENIETRELALLAALFGGTDFALPIIAEIKKRS